MKKLFSFAITAFLLASIVAPATAETIYNYSGLWQLEGTSGITYFSVDFTFNDNIDYYLYIKSSIDGTLLLINSKSSGTTPFSVNLNFAFDNDNNSWYAYLSQDNKLSLGNAPQFYIVFYDGQNYINQYDVITTNFGSNNYIRIDNGDTIDIYTQSGAVMVQTASPPVPLPGSALLLGSGLLGLALVWRRQQRRR